jgi:hypothetical protein
MCIYNCLATAPKENMEMQNKMKYTLGAHNGKPVILARFKYVPNSLSRLKSSPA